MCGIARQILVMGLGWFQRLGQDFILPHILPFWMARLHVIYCKPQQLPHYRIKPLWIYSITFKTTSIIALECWYVHIAYFIKVMQINNIYYVHGITISFSFACF